MSGSVLAYRGRGGERTGGEVGVDGAEDEAPVVQPAEGREIVSGDGGVSHSPGGVAVQ